MRKSVLLALMVLTLPGAGAPLSAALAALGLMESLGAVACLLRFLRPGLA
jgi:hypothetical protein